MSNSFDDMRDDYSVLFARSTPVRGKYYELAMREKGFVRLDDELLKAFPTSAELNAALRGLMEASRHVHLTSAA
jgi:hypothetical protein